MLKSNPLNQSLNKSKSQIPKATSISVAPGILISSQLIQPPTTQNDAPKGISKGPLGSVESLAHT